jgi:DNA-binding MarR family transcriptional regulator
VARLLLDAELRCRPLLGASDRIGVTPRMLAMLRHLDEAPTTVSEAARELGVPRATVADLVARLEARGLVGRERDEADRRRVLALPSGAGRAALLAAGRPAGEDMEEILARMGPHEREGLLAGLSALTAAAAQPRG